MSVNKILVNNSDSNYTHSIFDISEYTGQQYSTLSDALNDILQAKHKGGMTIRYIDSNDKYVQFRYMGSEVTGTPNPFLNVDNWEEYNSNIIDGGTLFVIDSNNNIIAKIDKNGVHSVDFRVGANSTSLVAAISNEVTAREDGDATVTGLVEAEEARAKAVEDTKLNYNIADDNFTITDANGYIICKIDASGVHSVNIDENPDTIVDNKFCITDANGYIICKIDANGVHSAKDKHAVACMVLSESYYPTVTPTRDSDGNITYAEVMFETGVTGNISITYTNGISSSVAVVYGNYNYTVTINRDSNSNVTTVSVE